MQLTIQRKLLAMSLLGLGFVVAVGATGFYAATSLARAADDHAVLKSLAGEVLFAVTSPKPGAPQDLLVLRILDFSQGALRRVELDLPDHTPEKRAEIVREALRSGVSRSSPGLLFHDRYDGLRVYIYGPNPGLLIVELWRGEVWGRAAGRPGHTRAPVRRAAPRHHPPRPASARRSRRRPCRRRRPSPLHG